MHVRRRVPFLKIVPREAVLAKLGIAKAQLIFSQVIFLPRLRSGVPQRIAMFSRCFQSPNSR